MSAKARVYDEDFNYGKREEANAFYLFIFLENTRTEERTMGRIKWKGKGESLFRWYNQSATEEFSNAVRDDMNCIIVFTTSDSKTDELSITLKYGFMQLDEFKEKVIDTDAEKSMIFEAGRLYGAMQLSSQICYEKKKDSRAFETALTVCGIKHFDDIISQLDKNRLLTQTQLCSELDLPASTLSDCLKRILKTNLVVCKRSGKYKVYSLSDDGMRYAKLHRIEANRENKKWSSFISAQFHNMVFNSLSSDTISSNELLGLSKNKKSYLNDIDYETYEPTLDEIDDVEILNIISSEVKE